MEPPDVSGSQDRDLFYYHKDNMPGNNNGAIAIIYRIKNNNYEFLLATQKSGMTNFVGGGKEPVDGSDEDTVKREISEETTLSTDDYELIKTSIYHHFVYSGKKERNGQEWYNKVFIAKVSPSLEIKPTSEIDSLNWYNKEEAVKTLSFEDMKEVFISAINIIEGGAAMNYKIVKIDQNLAEAIKQSYGEKAFDHINLDDGASLAALDNSQVVGFISASWKTLPFSSVSGDTEAYIDIIEVHSNFRRQGIAKALIEELSRAALEHGCYQLRAWSSEDKKDAILMWKNLGFGFDPQEIISEMTKEKVKGYFISRPL